MFEQAGHSMDIYDLFFADDRSVFKKKYDFICATEVAEHLHHPMVDLNRLWNCLKPGGFLGLMTDLLPAKSAFPSWHYKRDETHITFFSIATFKWIARQLQADFFFEKERVIIFQK